MNFWTIRGIHPASASYAKRLIYTRSIPKLSKTNALLPKVHEMPPIVDTRQGLLFADALERTVSDGASSTFVNNMSLPIHRWFRYSAGFSAAWVSSVIRQFRVDGAVRLFDPFAGSATTLIEAEREGVECIGIDSHPFIARIARAKLHWRTDPDAYKKQAQSVRDVAMRLDEGADDYPELVQKCYDRATLKALDSLRRAHEQSSDGSAASELTWLTLVSILRKTSTAGTAQWQYVLPRKQKQRPMEAFSAFDAQIRMFYADMQGGRSAIGNHARFMQADARDCNGVPDGFANLVITSPPYPNNYDYADATRLEMSFMREINGWGDLQSSVRQFLIRSCSQHVPCRTVDMDLILAESQLDPIRRELTAVCSELAEVRMTKGGKKTYHLMVACYFRDLALVWQSLRRVCDQGARVCFVIGDSAPYGVYVPVIPWLGNLAIAAGFKSYTFERTRDRNVKWKNRKHRVPLQEGRLWVEG